MRPIPLRSGPILPTGGLRQPFGRLPTPNSGGGPLPSGSGLSPDEFNELIDGISRTTGINLEGVKIPRPTGTSPSASSSSGSSGSSNTQAPAREGSSNLEAPPGSKWIVRTEYKYRSLTRIVYVNGQLKFEHIGWDLEGSGQQILTAPLKLVWLLADPDVVANYINPPSEYQWIGIQHATGTYYFTGNSSAYFSISNYWIRPDGTPATEERPGLTPELIPEAPNLPNNPQVQPSEPGRAKNPYSPFQPPFIFRPPSFLPPTKNPGLPRIPFKIPGRNAPFPGTPKRPEDPSNPDGTEPSTDRGLPGVDLPPGTSGRGAPGRSSSQLKSPEPAGDRCTPKGSLERMSCRYQKESDEKLDEVLKRLGKPLAEGGLAGIIGKEKPIHPITKLPTNLVTMSKLNFLTSAISAVFAPFNFLTGVHNAFMLSADIKETLGSFLSTTLDVTRTALSLKDPDDAMIDINDIVNKNFEALMDNLLGASNWETIKKRAAAVNRIYMAQANAMEAVKNAFENLFDAVGTIGNYTGKIGNGLKRAQVVYEDAYDWMDTQRASEMGRLGRFSNLTGRIEGVENAANMLLAVASSVKEVQEGAKDLADSLGEYEKAKAQAEMEFGKSSIDAKKNQKEALAPDSFAEVEIKTFDFEDN